MGHRHSRPRQFICDFRYLEATLWAKVGLVFNAIIGVNDAAFDLTSQIVGWAFVWVDYKDWNLTTIQFVNKTRLGEKPEMTLNGGTARGGFEFGGSP